MKKNDDTMEVWNDPELEARVVAMLMGELSEFETAELKQELEKSPELRLFRDRMVEVQNLITTVETEAGNDEEWKLSPECRKNLLDSFTEDPEQAIEREVSTTSIQWKNIASVAACFVLTMVVMAVMFPVKLFKRATVDRSEVEVVSYNAIEPTTDDEFRWRYEYDENEYGVPELPDSVGKKNATRGRNVFPETPVEGIANNRPVVPRRSQLGDPDMVQMSDKQTVYPKPAPKKPLPPASGAIASNGRNYFDDDRYASGGIGGGATFRGERRKDELKNHGEIAKLGNVDGTILNSELNAEIQSDPSSPSSDMSKVIGASKHRGVVAIPAQDIPAPDIAMLEPSIDFSSGQDFGSGWGGDSDGYRGSLKDEIARFSEHEGKTRNYAGREITGAHFARSSADPFDDIRGNFSSLNGVAQNWERDKVLYFDTQHEIREFRQSNHSQLLNGKSNLGLSTLDYWSNRVDGDSRLSQNLYLSKGVGTEYSSRSILGGEHHFSDDAEKTTQLMENFKLSNSVDEIRYKEKPSSLIHKEITRRKSLISEADRDFDKGRKAYAQQNYEEAQKQLNDALNKLPQGPIAADRRRAYSNDLAKVTLGLSKKYVRDGRAKEAEKMVQQALLNDPDNDLYKKELEYLSDPLRTSPTQDFKHAKDVERVRKGLHRAEAYYNQAQFDQAKLEYEEVLRKDPYNTAARKGMQRVNRAKSDYYRSAYDHNRSAMLLEVDKTWEIPVVPKGELKSDKRRVVLPFKEEVITAQNQFSTFSLNVSDVSFKLAKAAMLERGEMPEASKVRVEEFVNAFDYGDPSASVRDKVACAIEQCAHPFYQQRNLMRVSMKTAAIGRNQPLKLTILLDNSGSMEREDREATVLKAMQVLAQQLDPQDEVTLISFARNARLVADSLKGNQAGKLVKLIQAIPSEGGTNLSLGLEEARKITKARMKKGSMSRIVLITDGAANLGNANPDSLTKMVEEMRQEGIAFDACGVGAKELNDDVLEALTRKGDGRYYFINKPEEANANFAQKIAGALRPAAQNVKVQVVFNPKRVKKHKLLGFEKHRLKKEDFRNDKVDAAEMAANEAGNALYQTEVDPNGEGDVGVVFVRFRDMSTGRMVERSWTIPYDAQAPILSQAKPSMQLAAVAGLLGERLRSSENLLGEMQQLAPSLGKLRTHYHCDQRVLDLIRMCEALKN